MGCCLAVCIGTTWTCWYYSPVKILLRSLWIEPLATNQTGLWGHDYLPPYLEIPGNYPEESTVLRKVNDQKHKI